MASAASPAASSLDDWLVVLDSAGNPRSVDRLEATLDTGNRTLSIQVADSKPGLLRVLAREDRIRENVSYPALDGKGFVVTTYKEKKWYDVSIPDPTAGVTLRLKDFRPEVGRAWYTSGSPRSIALERPMFVSLDEIPRVDWQDVTKSNRNGTWTERQPVPRFRLGMNFTDVDTKGQRVALNRSWLGTLGLPNPYFQDADGKAIANTSDAHFFYLKPKHFSILYAFTTSEGFTMEDPGTHSAVSWDALTRNIYILSDRQDPVAVDERLRSPSPASVVYDRTTSFTVRATWRTTQQGNWQDAAPLFFMAEGNHRIHMANSVYVFYYSRAQGGDPEYYFRYLDSAGVLRVNHLVTDVDANTQYEFLLGYDGYIGRMTFALYDAGGSWRGGSNYTLGPSETFSLGKVGAGAMGKLLTYEPTTIGWTDNLYFDANMARNGNFELGGTIPTNWQQYPGSAGAGARFNGQAKFGSYSHRIVDTSASSSYGLQTIRMGATPDRGYLASTWVYVESGGPFNLYMEFWNSMTGGTTPLATAFKSTTTMGQWEYLDLTMIAPSGTVAVDVLIYASLAATGTVYFDGAELRLRRSVWGATTHDADPTPPGGLAAWQMAFDRAVELGLSYVRTDLRWNAFQSVVNGNWNTQLIDYWKSILQIGKARGIDPIVILNGPAPSGLTQPNQFAEFGEFCQKMAQEFGSGVYFYQILNEHNTNPEIGAPADLPNFASACYNGLLAGEAVSAAGDKSAFKTIVNVNANDGGSGWYTTLRGWLDAAGQFIDIPAIDHYPSTYTGDTCPPGDPDAWAPLDSLFQILKDYSKEGAIMETGFSTNGDLIDHGQDDQEVWVNCNLPFIRGAIRTHNLNNPTKPLLIASWYELYDVETCTGGANPLNHFGLLQSAANLCPPGYVPYGPKLAYDDFRARVAEYTW